MQEHRLSYSVQRMATVFEVSLSGYYDWLNRGISKQKQHHNRCELLGKPPTIPSTGLLDEAR